MIRHFFLDKTNTIVENSFQNLGLNPILHLGYGKGIIRGIIDFELDEIKKLINDKTFNDINKLQFRLKMTNCFSIDSQPYEKILFGTGYQDMKRAASFDLIAFVLPRDFDEGRGYEFTNDVWVRNCSSVSTEGSNWYFAKNGIPWSATTDEFDLTNPNLNWRDVLVNKAGLVGGVYSGEFLEEEYKKFKNGEDSVIVSEQHFDFGQENLNMDITSCVINSLNKDRLCLGLAFSPNYEKLITDIEQYVGFFNDNTNTFFHPYVEVLYDDYIDDDRESFTINRENRLYLYVSDDGQPVNLDELPTCSIGGSFYDVKQVTKGVYYATIYADSSKFEPASIYYDVWSNIKLNNVNLSDVELEFSTRPTSHKIKITDNSKLKHGLVPSIYGIYNDETINIGEVREITVDFRSEYSTNKKELIDFAEYRIYVKDGNREIDILPFQPVEKAFLNNFFVIYSEDLIPNKYYIDIKIKIGRETKFYKDILHFNVSDNVTERYQ